jgi:hypothetical protein
MTVLPSSENGVLCHECGTRNSAEDPFCVACGSSIANPAEAALVADDADEKRRQRREKARALAQKIHKAPSPSLPATEGIDGLFEQVIATTAQKWEAISARPGTSRLVQFWQDKLAGKTIISNSPFQMPEHAR